MISWGLVSCTPADVTIANYKEFYGTSLEKFPTRSVTPRLSTLQTNTVSQWFLPACGTSSIKIPNNQLALYTAKTLFF